jgi:hypothetical protein
MIKGNDMVRPIGDEYRIRGVLHCRQKWTYLIGETGELAQFLTLATGMVSSPRLAGSTILAPHRILFRVL